MTTATPSASEDLGSTAQRERRTRILDAARDLACTGGFDAVQMRSVAERADVALGTLYRYFPSKIHLLVSVLGRQFDDAAAHLARHPVPGATRAERVLHVLDRMARAMQAEPRLSEALTRAFMFADGSVADEIGVVGAAMSSIVTGAMHAGEPDDLVEDAEDAAVARVIGDVWLSAVMAWVTGRATAAGTAAHIQTAIRLVLRD